MGSFRAELLKLRKRVAVWVLGGILVAIVGLLTYGLTYALFRAPGIPRRFPPGESADDFIRILLPFNFVAISAENSSGLGSALALILGVLSIGSEYGWGTLKTIFTQGPSRRGTYLGRVAALAVITLVFTLLTFGTGALCSYLVALGEGAKQDWPATDLIVRGILASWLVTYFWATFGMLLATLFQQSALAIGIGLVYSILLEGLIFGLFRGLSFVETVQKFFPGVNASALTQSFRSDAVGASIRAAQQTPIVGAKQATLVLLGYLLASLVIAGVVLRRRDVVN